MADEDDFDIDIYGDDKPEFVAEPVDHSKVKTTELVAQQNPDLQELRAEPETEPPVECAASHTKIPDPGDPVSEGKSATVTMKEVTPTAGSIGLASDDPNGSPAGEDSRPLAPGATSALKLSELQWYTTEDEIRGWANQAKAEDELNEITFSEHKINGKSKGEAFIDLQTAQAASAMKWHLDQMIKDQPAAKKIVVAFAAPEHNPFKAYAKDASTRNRDNSKDRPVNSYSNHSYNSTQTGFRGGRGNYNRGGFHNQSRGGFNSTHNNGQLGMGGNFGGMNNMAGMGSFNNTGFNRGGFHGNRGGRGGMMGGNMCMMPNMGMGGMGGMGAMGGMGMGMGMDMGMGMGGMGNMGFGGFPQGQFNQQQQQHFGGNAQSNMSNPHGAKRQRPE